MKAKGQSFILGTAILMSAAFIAKIIGALFKIPLAAILGGEGMGYFMTAYSIFNPVYALSAAGFPIAVSKLTAAAAAQGRFADKKRYFAVALLLFPAIGIALFAIIFAGAPYFAFAVDNELAVKAIKAIAPSVIFCCITSAFRGYYEGSRNMIPTAFSQVAEAAVKLVFGLIFAYKSVENAISQFNQNGNVYGVPVENMSQAITAASPYAAAAAVSAVAVSTAIGSLVMVVFYLLTEKEYCKAPCRVTRKAAAALLMNMAMPVCAGALVINLSSLVDLASVMNRINFAAMRDWEALCKSHPEAMLEAMQADRVANFLFGSYTGLAMTVFNLVPALTACIGISALPMIAALAACGKKHLLRGRIESVLRITIIIAMPMGLGMSCMAEPILTALFKNNPLEVAVAAKLLKPLGAASVFVALSGAINSMLQAIGRVYIPLKLLLCGALIKFFINWFLISQPIMNISGAPWGTLCCYAFITLCGLHILTKSVEGNTGLFAMMIKPFIASMVCCAAAISGFSLFAKGLSQRFATVTSVLIGAVFYVVVLLLIGGFDKNDMYFLKKR